MEVLPSGKLSHNYGKSPCGMNGKVNDKWPFSIANNVSLPAGNRTNSSSPAKSGGAVVEGRNRFVRKSGKAYRPTLQTQL
jgi:hypothetical protein